MSLPEIPKWTSRSLQGLAYWLGYQDALGVSTRLSEGAIATEVLKQMSFHRDKNMIIEPEVLYRHIPELEESKKRTDTNIRADLVIAFNKRADKRIPHILGSVEAVIEIKHNRSQKRKIYKDIDRMSNQGASSNGRVRGFLLYASLSTTPRFVDENGTARNVKIETTDSGTRYKVRRVCKALPKADKKKDLIPGHYAILIEVI